MSGRKKEADDIEEVVEPVKVQSDQALFTKEQILSSAKFRNRRDLVDALLDEKLSYTIETVDKLVNSFMKGQVK